MVDGFESLRQDHQDASRLFAEYEASGDGSLVRELCAGLARHAEIEEEVFYPTLRSILAEGAELADDCLNEHAAMQSLIAHIEQSPPEDLTQPIEELRALFDHHVQVEEGEILPKMREAGISPDALGLYLETARQEASARHPLT